MRPPSDDFKVGLLLDALAVARLARLTTVDVITEPLREPLVRWAGDRKMYRLREFLGCQWCQSVWLAAAVVVARKRWPRQWDPIARCLAFSEIAGLAASATH